MPIKEQSDVRGKPDQVQTKHYITTWIVTYSNILNFNDIKKGGMGFIFHWYEIEKIKMKIFKKCVVTLCFEI